MKNDALKPEIIYEDKHITITFAEKYDEKFLSLAEDTLWGTEGIIYKMNDLGDKFDKFKNSIFVSLKENEELTAICVLKQKQVHQNNEAYNVFYGCVGAAHPEKMSKGYFSLLYDKITEYIFAKYDKVLIYAYVEEGNKRSRKMLHKINYRPITMFIAPTYVCLKPKINKNVINLDKEDKLKIINLLNNQYDNRSFVDINESFDPESYYVFKENNEIKAGLQIKISRWSFFRLAGFEGFLMMKIVPKLPIFKKIFNPKNHSFLQIGNIYIGDSDSFTKLLNSVLVLTKLHTCLAYSNPNAAVDSKVIAEMQKGVLSSVKSKVFMFCKSKNIPLSYLDKPQFLSLADPI